MQLPTIHFMKRADRGGFTLVELLVSVGIIAVLVALALPVFGKVRAGAQKTSCASQLRQLYIGMVAYAQEHRGYLPRGGSNGSEEPGFDGWIGTAWMKPTTNPQAGFPPYCGGQEVVDQLVVCPLNRMAVNATQGREYTPRGYPYICNYVAMTNSGNSARPASLWTVDTSKLVILADSGTGTDWIGPGFGATSLFRVKARHSDQCNVLWADGRVTSMLTTQLRAEDLQPVNR